jgi:hypothetical protein
VSKFKSFKSSSIRCDKDESINCKFVGVGTVKLNFGSGSSISFNDGYVSYLPNLSMVASKILTMVILHNNYIPGPRIFIVKHRDSELKLHQAFIKGGSRE